MNTNSTTTLPCAGCNRYLGDVMQPLVVDFDGFRYRLCGYGCADRLMQRLTATSTTSTSATHDTVRVYGVNGLQSRTPSARRWA
jgi:hypothetical protein